MRQMDYARASWARPRFERAGRRTLLAAVELDEGNEVIAIVGNDAAS
jgi:hypothetical protein